MHDPETRKNFVQVRIFNQFFLSDSGERRSEYWIHESCIRPVTEQINYAIPVSVNRAHGGKDREEDRENSVTLIKPYRSPKTQRTYSVGTRFVRAPKKDRCNSCDKSVPVYLYNPVTEKICTSMIPCVSCFDYLSGSSKDLRRVFIELLRMWCSDQVIPYVWAGCSGIRSVENLSYYKAYKIPVMKRLHIGPGPLMGEKRCHARGSIARDLFFALRRWRVCPTFVVILHRW